MLGSDIQFDISHLILFVMGLFGVDMRCSIPFALDCVILLRVSRLYTTEIKTKTDGCGNL